MAKTPKSTRWCFDMPLTDEPPFPSLPDYAKYVIFQGEEGKEDGYLHWQGFMILTKERTLTWLKKNVHPTAHFEIAKKVSAACANYCRKTDTQIIPPTEYGILAVAGSHKRSLMEAFKEDPETMSVEDPAKYRRCLALEMNIEFKNGEIPEIHGHWQSNLRHRLMDAPDFRTVFWIFGKEGNEGKTLLAKKLTQEGWFYSPGGKVENMLYLYMEDPRRNVVIDIPRSHQEYVNYACIEQIKNRMIQSTKYEPVTVTDLNPVHVVVMANFLPQLEDTFDDKGHIKPAVLSADRVIVICCTHGARSCKYCY
nr:Rep [Pittosporum tobira alphasatellite]